MFIRSRYHEQNPPLFPDAVLFFKAFGRRNAANSELFAIVLSRRNPKLVHSTIVQREYFCGQQQRHSGI